jgi:hypothetical protein
MEKIDTSLIQQALDRNSDVLIKKTKDGVKVLELKCTTIQRIEK